MKVLFLQFLPNVGHIGDIKEVSDSYARNFLIPKGYAQRLTVEEEKRLSDKLKKEEQQRREIILNRHKITDELNGKTFVFHLKVGNGGKIFGSIGEKDIIEKIFIEKKIKLEKKHIDMGQDGHIKKIGRRDVFIKLGSDSMAKIEVILKGEGM